MSVSVEYVGFQANSKTRDYSFVVRESLTDPFKITFAIQNKTFRPGSLSFQNAPDICSLRLQREMADTANQPLKAHYEISEVDAEEYQKSHSPKKTPGRYVPRTA